MIARPNRRGKFGERFEVGDEIGGVGILGILPDRLSGRSYAYSWRYKVECLRCNRPDRMLHKSIVDRIRSNRKGCSSCSHLHSYKNLPTDEDDVVLSFDYDKWIDPPWDVPSHGR